MNLLCRLAIHRHPSVMVWNQGWYFGECGDCGRTLIKLGRNWVPVPRGYRVTWKPKTRLDIFGETIPNPHSRGRSYRLPPLFRRRRLR